MNKILVSLFILVVLLHISGCGISRGTINSYIEPTYIQGSVKRLAVFSVRNARFAPSEARQINRKLIQALVTKNPKLQIVSPSEALRIINDNDLASKWADFVEDYYTSGIANHSVLSEISKYLKVDGVLQGQLLNVFQVDGDNWSRKGKTRVSISFSIVETHTAKTVWEATADGIKGNVSALSPAPPVADALELAIQKIIINMPLL
jgi:hypothetical protein